MAIQATVRKIKRSFTLAPEVAAFVTETRARRRAGSDSEALNLLLRESMLAARRQEIDAAFKEYFDSATDEELAEGSEWAQMAGRNALLEVESTGAGA